MINIAINGIGRIGKIVTRLLLQGNYKVTYLNEINGDTISLIHSLEFDSIHGKWDCDFQANEKFIKINI